MNCLREAKCFWLKVGFLVFAAAGLWLICTGWLSNPAAM